MAGVFDGNVFDIGAFDVADATATVLRGTPRRRRMRADKPLWPKLLEERRRLERLEKLAEEARLKAEAEAAARPRRTLATALRQAAQDWRTPAPVVDGAIQRAALSALIAEIDRRLAENEARIERALQDDDDEVLLLLAA